MIPEEEAEWVGLSLQEAVEKQRLLEKKVSPKHKLVMWEHCGVPLILLFEKCSWCIFNWFSLYSAVDMLTGGGCYKRSAESNLVHRQYLQEVSLMRMTSHEFSVVAPQLSDFFTLEVHQIQIMDI